MPAQARICLLVLAILSSVALPDDELPRPPALPVETEPEDTLDVLFLAVERPVAIRLHVRVDGRSFRAPWLEFAAKLFHELDTNGDGVLAGVEWEGLQSAQLSEGLYQPAPRAAPSSAEGVSLAPGQALIGAGIDLDPVNNLITLEEFIDHFVNHNLRPMLLQAVGANRTGYGVGPNGADGQLFSRLDTGADGMISASEFAAGAQVLARIDFDDDGSFSLNELQAGRVNSMALDQPVQDPRRVARPAQFVDLSQQASGDAIVRQILDRYDLERPSRDPSHSDRPGYDRLSPEELKLPPDQFQRLDRTGDREIDFEELRQIGKVTTPVLEIVVRIGSRAAGQKSIEVVWKDSRLSADVRVTSTGEMAIYIGGEQLELAADGSSSDSQIRMQMQRQFKAADRDNNNYLDRMEVQRTLFAQTFDAMDEDGDGMLYERELLQYAGRREAAAGSRCVMSVGDEGRNLFQILDVNRDGRLSPRELTAAARRIREWDTDKDERLTEGEIPSHYRVTFARAQPTIVGFPIATPRAARTSTGLAVDDGSGPAWFRRMDKNRDGDVSRREFLGSQSIFETLDTNRDGLIEVGEAAARREGTSATGE